MASTDCPVLTRWMTGPGDWECVGSQVSTDHPPVSLSLFLSVCLLVFVSVSVYYTPDTDRQTGRLLLGGQCVCVSVSAINPSLCWSRAVCSCVLHSAPLRSVVLSMQLPVHWSVGGLTAGRAVMLKAVTESV